MAHLVHRRRAAAASTEPGGPGATVGPIVRRFAARLTDVGWASLAATAVYLIIAVWPYVVIGRPIGVHGDPVTTVALRLTGAFAVALPAALEAGNPRVARRNRRLLLGLALLAAAEFLGQPAGWIQAVLFTAAYSGPPGDGTGPTLLILSRALGLVIGAVWVAGWTVVAVGLGRAGAGPRTALLAGVVIAAVVADGLSYVVEFTRPPGNLDAFVSDPGFAASVAMTLASQAAAVAAALALVTGVSRRLPPRRAWVLGGAAGIAEFAGFGVGLLQATLNPSNADGSTDLTLYVVGRLLMEGAVWTLLVMACGLGLAQGTGERGDRQRRTTYLVRGDRRVRTANAPR